MCAHSDVTAELSTPEIEQMALMNEKVKAFLADKAVKKIITVPGKIVNIVI